MMLMFLLVLFVLVGIVACVLNRRRPKVVRFVGPRGTGKTRTVNALLGVCGETVPTLESYKVLYKDLTIHDMIEKEGDFLERYSIDDPDAVYFFFLRDIGDLDKFPVPKDFDVRFVHYEPLEAGRSPRGDVIILDGNPAEIKKYLT